MPIAQLNIARAKWPIEDERMAGFTSRIDEVNAAAEAAPGFVWRLEVEDGGGSSYLEADDDPNLLVNVSGWESVDALRDFVLAAGHRSVMAQRSDWFEPGTTKSIVWDIPADYEPSVDDALAVLAAWEKGEGPAKDMRKLLTGK